MNDFVSSLNVFIRCVELIKYDNFLVGHYYQTCFYVSDRNGRGGVCEGCASGVDVGRHSETSSITYNKLYEQISVDETNKVSASSSVLLRDICGCCNTSNTQD